MYQGTSVRCTFGAVKRPCSRVGRAGPRTRRKPRPARWRRYLPRLRQPAARAHRQGPRYDHTVAYHRQYLKHTLKGPPHEALLTEDDLAGDFAGGDFTRNPWFEAPDLDRYFTLRGFPKHRREIAVAALRRLYPPGVCRDLLRRPWHGALLLPLFKSYIVPHVFTCFQLGLDLDAARPWDDSDLLARLRNRNMFAEAWNELEVWANLREAAIEHRREPLTLGGKRPDFALYLNYRQYFLEVKLLDESDAEAFANEFHRELSCDVPSELFRACQKVTVRSSPEYAALAERRQGLDRLDAEREVIREALRRAYGALVTADVPIGVYSVTPFATIAVEAAKPGSSGNEVEVQFVPQTSPKKRALRAARLVASAFEQFPADGIGIMMVQVREDLSPEAVAERVTDWARRNPIASRNCEIVVVRVPARLPDDRTAQAAWVVPLHGHQVTDQETRVLQVVARPRHGPVPDPWGGDEPAERGDQV